MAGILTLLTTNLISSSSNTMRPLHQPARRMFWHSGDLENRHFRLGLT
jgi:hypothetical protein